MRNRRRLSDEVAVGKESSGGAEETDADWSLCGWARGATVRAEQGAALSSERDAGREGVGWADG